MGSPLRRTAVVLVAALVFGLVPRDLPAEAACSPRTFSELGPAPNDVPPPPAPAPEPEPPTDPTDPAAPTDPTTPAPPPAEEPAPIPVTPPPPRCSFVYRMDFPLVGSWNYLSVFGAVREAGERWHAGVDIQAPKLTPVTAVRGGTVTQANRNGQGDCCWVAIRHTDGWSSLYVHLNNDLATTDDGTGVGIRRGLEVGDEVVAGQVIGWVGDSGNAEPTVPHIHFELRTPWGEAVDPLPSLRRAASRAIPGLIDVDVSAGFDGPFVDDEALPEEDLIGLALTLGVPLACDDFGLRFCPDAAADEATALSWIEALMTDRLSPPPIAPPEDEVTDAPSEDILFTGIVEASDVLGFQPIDEAASIIAEHQRLLRLCGDACATVLTAADATRLIELYLAETDDLPDTSTPVTVVSIEDCSLPGVDTEAGLSRLALLRVLMRAFGHLETPPCDRIS